MAGLWQFFPNTKCDPNIIFFIKVIYYFESSAGFHLLDGDRIATLVAGHLQQLLAEAGLTDLVKAS